MAAAAVGTETRECVSKREEVREDYDPGTLEAVFPSRSPLKPKQIVEPPKSTRVQPMLQ